MKNAHTFAKKQLWHLFSEVFSHKRTFLKKIFPIWSHRLSKIGTLVKQLTLHCPDSSITECLSLTPDFASISSSFQVVIEEVPKPAHVLSPKWQWHTNRSNKTLLRAVAVIMRSLPLNLLSSRITSHSFLKRYYKSASVAQTWFGKHGIMVSHMALCSTAVDPKDAHLCKSLKEATLFTFARQVALLLPLHPLHFKEC